MTRVLVLVALALAGCTSVKHASGDVFGPVAEVIVCPVDLVNCGHVYLCAQEADNPLGHVEICVDDDDSIADVEAAYGACEPTPRHEGLCIACCGEGCGRGANSFSGTWCPEDP